MASLQAIRGNPGPGGIPQGAPARSTGKRAAGARMAGGAGQVGNDGATRGVSTGAGGWAHRRAGGPDPRGMAGEAGPLRRNPGRGVHLPASAQLRRARRFGVPDASVPARQRAASDRQHGVPGGAGAAGGRCAGREALPGGLPGLRRGGRWRVLAGALGPARRRAGRGLRRHCGADGTVHRALQLAARALSIGRSSTSTTCASPPSSCCPCGWAGK